MNITLSNIGKRYNYEWIFRKIDHQFSSESNYVLLGSNGSGKSTLLQVIAGNLIPSEGQIKFNLNNTEIDQEEIYHHISFAAPYLDLLEEFTLTESIEFQKQFKPFRSDLETDEIINITGLRKSKDKQLKFYSSGMKQRVKLALAVLADTPLLLLDEPTSNLDKNAIDWYQKLIDEHSKSRLIIVASNQQEYEYTFCNKEFRVEDFK
ncbi:MAG: transporter ATP-binding protein [Bacteroidetes bacterium]|jgi:ABC-type multidrug transport system ATPase subunit|nr:transporter ATP-binding protein [Bacteroidota bacterium]